MNRQEVIEWLEGWLYDYCDALEVEEEFTPYIVENIIDLLRAQEEAEKNEPVTLDELRQMDGEPVWVTVEDDRPMPFMVDTKNPCQIMRDPRHGALSVLDIADYGKTWLAYRRKPKEGKAHE